MEKSKIEVFTSPTCPYCPSAMEIIGEVARERSDVFVDEINMALPEGMDKAKQFQVIITPTVFVKGPMHNEILAVAGTPSKARLNELIDISQGKKKLKEDKGFFERVFEKIKGWD